MARRASSAARGDRVAIRSPTAAAALASRKTERAAAGLLATILVIFGATSAGTFTTISSPITARSTASRTLRRARPLSDFSLDEIVDGRVAFRTKTQMVCCDIGAERNALLQAPAAIARRLRNNETLKGLRVTKLDPEKGQLQVTHDSILEYMKDRVKLITNYAVGDVVDGRVSRKGRKVGVLIDIGAECEAKLQAPFRMAIKLRPNATLKGLVVTKVDLERRQMAVEWDQLEEAVRDYFKPVSNFSVGDVVGGRVVQRLAREGDVLIDIDAEVSAKLDAPPELRDRLQIGDVLEGGVRVTMADVEGNILRVAFDGLEAFLKEEGRIV